MTKIPLGFIQKRQKQIKNKESIDVLFVYLGTWCPLGKIKVFDSKTLKVVIGHSIILIYDTANVTPKFIEAIIDYKKFIPGKQAHAVIVTSKRTLRHNRDGIKRRTLHYNTIYISDINYLNLNITEKHEAVTGTLQEPTILAGKHIYQVTMPLRCLKKEPTGTPEQYCQTWLY